MSSVGATLDVSIGGGSTESVGAALSESVDGGITASVGGNWAVDAAGGFNITAAGGATLTLTGGLTIAAPGGVQQVDSTYNIICGHGGWQGALTIGVCSFKDEMFVLHASYTAAKVGICVLEIPNYGLEMEFAGKEGWKGAAKVEVLGMKIGAEGLESDN